MAERDLISSREAADILGVGLTTVHRWVINGRITPEATMPGTRGAHVFTRAEVESVAGSSRRKRVNA